VCSSDLLGGPFIARWIGPNYAEGGAWIIRFLGAGLLVEALSPNSTRILVSMNRHGRPASLALLIAVLGVPLTIVLAKLAGIAGIGLAVFLTKAATEVTWLCMATRALDLGWWEHLRRTFLRFVPAAILLAGTVAGLRRLREATDYPHILLYALIAAAVYAAAAWSSALDTAERGAILTFLGRLRRRMTGAQAA